MRVQQLIVAALIFSTACGEHVLDDISVLQEIRVDDARDPWSGLLHPINIDVDSAGNVFFADFGDKTVKSFDAVGRPIHVIGRAGRGPGEFQMVQDLAILSGEVIVLDPKLQRLVRMTPDGQFIGSVINDGMEEALSALGPRRIVLANSPKWSLPSKNGAAWPLIRIAERDGRTVAEIGEREPTENPFVAHIKYFVLPAGTPDGKWIWIAYLNDPKIELYSMETETFRSIPRDLPFEWRRIPEDYTPPAAAARPGGRPEPPFDPISLGIATDRSGRAYILTALESSAGNEGYPEQVAVDVVSPADTVITRYRVPEVATHIAVAPDGGLLYLLDAHSATVHVYRLPVE
ncbi:MAG TPA: hypothetical protein VF188_12535 [Longimicrobiales bacterium]